MFELYSGDAEKIFAKQGVKAANEGRKVKNQKADATLFQENRLLRRIEGRKCAKAAHK